MQERSIENACDRDSRCTVLLPVKTQYRISRRLLLAPVIGCLAIMAVGGKECGGELVVFPRTRVDAEQERRRLGRNNQMIHRNRMYDAMGAKTDSKFGYSTQRP
ncbi:hypothetical protein L228DRAFT_14598 [Xylona heveae TC161]|uniref:Uncharacterized protein n=1 Tax=Xylona heveae (strain CBS 132557 / TC161) TaxID=1328760 RepID=A0A165JR43_XYLHT|nr:hypothetical protein L228DRAFT_14598 [Xylona heveae TC161]KZF26531.1 hypothetical protein L228DRAFT_14598 [Xylona heveae TC161]